MTDLMLPFVLDLAATLRPSSQSRRALLTRSQAAAPHGGGLAARSGGAEVWLTDGGPESLAQANGAVTGSGKAGLWIR